MIAMSLRLPESLRQKLREMADRQNVSMNQMITLALAEKQSALMTEEYLVRWGTKGSKDDFDRALSKVADNAPEDADRILADG